jgi:hypothetical protein
MPPITLASLATTPYETGAGNVAAPTIHRAEHLEYGTAGSRATLNPVVHPMNPAMRSLRCAASAAGDTYFLPFRADHISSIRLPAAPPGGVDFFYTDNLSGCKIFVDTIAGSQDIMVYHANTTQHSIGPLAYADNQTALADTELDNLHTRAQADLGALVLNLAGSVRMPQYFLAAGVEERRKRHQGRTATAHDATPINTPTGAVSRVRPKFYGGCTVVGFRNGVKWDLYFQSWGEVAYARPGYARMLFTFDWVGVHKKRTLGEQTASYANFTVMDHQPFY